MPVVTWLLRSLVAVLGWFARLLLHVLQWAMVGTLRGSAYQVLAKLTAVFFGITLVLASLGQQQLGELFYYPFILMLCTLCVIGVWKLSKRI